MINKISSKDIIEFNRVFGLLLMSKLSIVDSLDLILKQTKNQKLRTVLSSVIKDIKAGDTLSNSFAKYQKIFPEIYIANLKVAEETGNIAEVLNEYTLYQEKFMELKRKIIHASRYPLFVILVAIGVVFFMLYFLIPTFETLFKSVQASLPPITAFLLMLSNMLIDNGTVLFIAFILLTLLSFIIFRNKKIKEKLIDYILLELPFVSSFYTQNLLARFSLSMGMLLRNSVPLLDSLRISKNISDNSIFKSEINSLSRNLVKGESLTRRIGNSKIFDITFIRLLSAGEQSAELDKVFYLISDYYSKEFDHKIEMLTSLIEPVLILLVGGIVAVVLIAMYLPMFEIINYLGV
ncbi:MAG: type II secretion system F family protein [Melioribacteraceae bacterium]|nr:type II secretion system F family protein [Melioribacteraceae bacterium]MCF8395090.1 type II secretion system F family protein [Melioribacteraceae bacterium]MCF8420363.1 type II secretion system F family protein [Melioribacteraceae bacterium]